MPIATEIKIEHVQLSIRIDEPHYEEVENAFFNENGKPIYNIKNDKIAFFNNLVFSNNYHNIR